MKQLLVIVLVVVLSQASFAQWQNTNLPILNNVNSLYAIRALGYGNGILYAGNQGGSVLMYRSTDEGLTWLIAENGVPAPPLVIAANDQIVVSGTYGAQMAYSFILSSNGGVNWTDISPTPAIASSNLCYFEPVAIAIKGSFIFVGTTGGPGGGVFASSDNGITWNAGSALGEGDTLGMSDAEYNIWSLAIIDTTVFAATSAGVYSLGINSAVQDQPWQPKRNGLGHPYSSSIVATGDSLFVGTPTGVYLSTDLGESWNSAGLSNYSITTLATHGPDLIAGVSGDSGVFISTNAGTSWQTFDDGLTQIELKQNPLVFASSATHLFLGTNDDGVWKRSFSDLSSVPTFASIPTLSIDAVFPNPVDASQLVTIAYSLPQSEEVNFSLYDALGIEQRSSIERSPSAGRRHLSFNASGLPSGIYFCRIRARNSTASTKIIIR